MKDQRSDLSTKDIANATAARRETETAVTEPSAEPSKKVVDVADDARAALFHDEEATGFRTRWEAIQTGFVDEPRRAVQEADALVAQVVARLAEVFSNERTELEHGWDRGDSNSTEDLRVALKRYRSFFDRLLSV